MYYVAKLSSVFKPTIVESFRDKDKAFQYANILTDENKGQFIVLEQISIKHKE